MLMRKIETPIERAEKILLGIDSIFLAGGSSSPSSEDAAKLIRAGKSILGELRRIAGNPDGSEKALRRLIESIETSIALAKKEISDES